MHMNNTLNNSGSYRNLENAFFWFRPKQEPVGNSRWEGDFVGHLMLRVDQIYPRNELDADF